MVAIFNTSLENSMQLNAEREQHYETILKTYLEKFLPTLYVKTAITQSQITKKFYPFSLMKSHYNS